MRIARESLGRTVRGQAIAEGVAAAVMLCMIAVPLLVLTLNVGMFFAWQSKLNFIATECARYIDANKYWLGMPRDDFKSTEAEKRARRLADVMCDALGVPKTTVFDVAETEVDFDGTKITVTRVELQAGLSVAFSGFIPKPLQVKGVGVSSDGAQAVPPYCTMVLEFGNSNDFTKSRAAVIPAYAAMKLNQSAPGTPGRGFSENSAPSPLAKFHPYTGPTTTLFATVVSKDPGWGAGNDEGFQVATDCPGLPQRNSW